ncbi:MAG: hypothetical protein D6718_12925 [Acidobacteria bacterium]|nr:MAG: hypothetical protein D6718_12925 [Acidobacteriota bacterium]
MLIGLTGPNAAGKGEVAALLARRGFAVHSLSDVVRRAAARRGLAPDRETLIALGREMRKAGGPGVLAEALVEDLEERAVVDSIRHPAEVAVLRRRPDFRLLGIDAPVEVRWRRARRRGRPGDDVTLDTFLAQEAEENRSSPTSQQLLRTLAEADAVVRNDGSLARLEGLVLRILSVWEKEAALTPGGARS